MPREDFERNLNEVQDDVVKLGSMVEKAVFKSIDCLKNRDIEGSQQVIDEDDVIDDMTQSIEDRCIDLIALEAPMASDLRGLISALMVSNELERMGDYASGIAQISIKMGPDPTFKELIDIPKMGSLSINMMKKSLQAVTENNREEALKMSNSILPDDDKVDQLNTSIQEGGRSNN